MKLTDYRKLSDRERDALIAEKVMGYAVGECIPAKAIAPYYSKDGASRTLTHSPFQWEDWEPTRDIKAAFEVVERLTPEWTFILESVTPDGWLASFMFGGELHEVNADTAPESICQAALLAVGAVEQ